LTEGRKQKGADWNDARDSAAEEAATLMVGDSGADGLIEKFKTWLDRAHDLDDAAFKQEFADPLRSAGSVTGEVDWSQVLRNWTQDTTEDTGDGSCIDCVIVSWWPSTNCRLPSGAGTPPYVQIYGSCASSFAWSGYEAVWAKA
jgi:hypothetical protein